MSPSGEIMHRFDLDTAISAWRRALAHRRTFSAEDADELEEHLRDAVEAAVRQGVPEADAFDAAVRRLGDLGMVEQEYRKTFWARIRHRRRTWRTVLSEAAMLQSYLKIALRNLRRQAGYAALNLLGLAVGLACFLVIALYVRGEWSVDRFHAHGDRLYRVVADLGTKDQPVQHLAATPMTVGPVLAADYAAVEAAVRLYRKPQPVAYEGAQHYEDAFFFADSAFFDVFTFPLAAGDPRTALAEPFTVVLTADAARRYFGAEDPMGRTLVVGGGQAYRVTGVLAPPPGPSHLTFDLVASFASLPLANWEYPWWSFEFYTYVLLAEGARAEALARQVYDVATRYVAADEETYGVQQRYRLQPVADVYLHADLGEEIGPLGDAATVYAFSAVAVLILLVACVNFTNLATAQAMRRAREVGMRRVLGAHRGQLVRQHLGEATLVALVACGLALVLLVPALPVFRALAGRPLPLDLPADLRLLPFLLALAGLVGMAAGAYPALVLARPGAVDVLKGVRTAGRGGQRLRKGLVVFQFAVSVFLIAATAVVHAQLGYLQHRNLGFPGEQLVVLPLRGSGDLGARFEAVAAALRQVPHVRGVTASNTVPGRALSKIGFVPEGTATDELQTIVTFTTDYDFADTYGLRLAAGRFLSAAYGTDAAEGFVLNAAAVRQLGWGTPEAALGRRLTWGWPGKEGRVVGVVQDFHYASLREPVAPAVFHVQPAWFDYVTLRLDGVDVAGTLSALEAAWRRQAPDRPFDYFFLDDDFGRQYAAEHQVGRLFTAFAGFALFIACLGLFGLAAFVAGQRTREVGIRKTLGAAVPGLVALLAKDFLALVAAGVVVAAPVAYLVMHRWLDGFAYHVAPSAAPYALAALIALTLAALAVGAQTIRAALADPVKTLRYE